MNVQKISLFVFCLVFFAACGTKNNTSTVVNPMTSVTPTNPTSNTLPAPITIKALDDVDTELEEAIAAAPSVTYKLEDALLPNGQTIKQYYSDHPEAKAEYETWLTQKKKSQGGKVAAVTYTNDNPASQLMEMVSKITNRSDYYCNILTFAWKAKGVDTGSPDQPFGLAYVLGGGRNYDPAVQRERPSYPPTGGRCPDLLLYGTDCSGFAYRVFTEAGYKITADIANGTDATSMSNLDFWKNIIRDNPDKLSGLRVDNVNNNHFIGETSNETRRLFKLEDLQLVDPKIYKPGDIIFWHKASGRASHMGLVLLEGGRLRIYQSNGTTDANTSLSMLACNSDYCTSNYLCESRGVHTKDLSWIPKVKGKKNPNKTMSIIRFSTDDQSMSCKVDGQAFSSTTNAIRGGIGISSLGANRIDLFFGSSNQVLQIVLDGFDYEIGQYYGGSDRPPAFSNSSVKYITGGQTFSRSISGDEIKVTRIDGDIMEGTFNFTIDGKKFTDGNFRVKVVTQY